MREIEEQMVMNQYGRDQMKAVVGWEEDRDIEAIRADDTTGR